MLTAVETSHSPEWHTQKIAEFAQRKAEIGEPSPHMKIVLHLTEGLPIKERLWMGGCYLNAYSVGTAEKIWEAWSYEDAVANPNGLAKWIRENWAGFHTRRERRCVRTPDNFIRAQIGVADWIQFGVRHLLKQPDLYRRNPNAKHPGSQAYDAWWRVANRIPFFGRYINIRLLEYANRMMPQLGLDLYDIRSIGGWSPVRALTLFKPERTIGLLSGDRQTADQAAAEVMEEVRAFYPQINSYVFAAMLCEYREAYEDGNQFPGHTHDQELAYASHPKFDHWDTPPKAIWEARSALFPKEVLGEASGWTEYRKPLDAVLKDHGYIWSDLLYDWQATTDLAKPVRRVDDN